MAQITPPVSLKCNGCNRHFNDKDDLAPARVGSELHQLCPSCYFTALGPANVITFDRAKELNLS